MALQPSPFDLHRFRPGPSGFLSPSSPRGSDPGGAPLIELCLSSKPSALQPHPRAQTQVHLSWGSMPLQRATNPGVRMSRETTTTSRHRPPSRFLTLSTVCSTRIHARLSSSDSLAKAATSPQRSWGSPAPFAPLRSFDPARATMRGLPLHGSLLLHDGHVLACPPFLCFAARLTPFRSRSRHAAFDGHCKVSIAEESVFAQ